jgi:phosphatidyl-myo-inositol dimannoside synthase
LRVLVLTTDAFGGKGGIAQYNRDMLDALCAYPECEEVIAVPRIMPDAPGQLPEKLTYVTSGLNGKVPYIRSVLKILARRPCFDLLISGHVNLVPVAYASSAWLGAPLVLFLYGVDAWEPPPARTAAILAKRVSAVVSISDLTLQRFRGWARVDASRAFVLPNAIRPDRFSPGPKPWVLMERYGLNGKRVLMTLGRLESAERKKGFDEVLELLPELALEMPEIAYLIVGDGSDRQRLQQKATHLGVGDRVVFTGYVAEEEKADHYRLADAFVMPSRGEGFGFVFLEAMACGIPVIGSKFDGSREALRHGELGILVEPGNREECAAAIRSALRRPRGVVPAGLEYFSFENFRRRMHSILKLALQA